MIIAATGHRPSYFPCKYNEDNKWLDTIKENLRQELTDHINEIEHVIQGVCIGWDMIFAEIALDLGIKVHSYSPFPKQADRWPKSCKDRHKNIIDKSDYVKIFQDKYSNYSFIERDKAMVDDSDFVWALWNEKVRSGGTFITIQEAIKQDKFHKNFWID